MKILILCTGNSCRSQMAEAFLKSFDSNLKVYSAGTQPTGAVHPKAIVVMAELGIAISANKPKSIEIFLNESFDFVITVCGDAKENCPAFMGNVKNRLHIGFDDPAEATGNDAAILNKFKRIRDEIKHDFFKFYTNKLQQ